MSSDLEAQISFCCSEFLKFETKNIHIRLENKLDFPESYRDINSYSKILSIFLIFQQELVRNVNYYQTSIPHDFDIENRKHVDLVIRDIHNLSRSPEILSFDSLDFQSLSECIGGLYVAEGSSLGGQIIHKVMLKMHGIEIEKSLHYLNRYGDATNSRWQQFKNALDGNVENKEIDSEQVLLGANKSFEFLISLVDKAGVRT